MAHGPAGHLLRKLFRPAATSTGGTGTAALTNAADTVAGVGDWTAPPGSFTGSAARTEAGDTVVGVGDWTAQPTFTGSAALTNAADTVVGVGDWTASTGAVVFGYDVIGTLTDTPSSIYGNQAPISTAGRNYTAVTGDVVTSVSVYGSTTAGGHAAVGIYTVSGGIPVTRVGPEIAVAFNASPQWQTVSTSIALSAGVEYTAALRFWVDNPWTLRWDTTGPTTQSQAAGGALPATWVATGTDIGMISYYATVSPSTVNPIVGSGAPVEADDIVVAVGDYTPLPRTGSAVLTHGADTAAGFGAFALAGRTGSGARTNVADTATGVGTWTPSRSGAGVLVDAPNTVAGVGDYTAGLSTGTGAIVEADDVTVGVSQAFNFPYPTTVSSRRLLDQNGQVFLVKGMSSWALGQNATNTEITTALNGLAVKGFNTVVACPFGVNSHPGDATWHPYTNVNGDSFFTGTPFASPLGPAWSSMDWIMREATRLGMTVFFSSFISWGSTGTQPEITAAGTANMRTYGAAVATRYAGYRNIVWHLMGDDTWDATSTLGQCVDAYHRGIADIEGGTRRLITAEPNWDKSSYTQFISQEGTSPAGYQWFHVDVNTPIRDPAESAVNVSDAAYNEVGATTEAVWIDEPMYVNSDHYGGNPSQQTRERNYATFLRGGVGINFGNEYWWPAGSRGLYGGIRPGWIAEVLADPTTFQAKYCWDLVDRVAADNTWLPSSTFVPEGHVSFPNANGNWLSTPDAAALDITGDICITARIRPTTWTPTLSYGIVCKWRTGALSYAFRLNTTGTLGFLWSANGTSTTGTVNSSVALSGPIDWLYVAVTLDVSDAGNRVTRFWTSTNGSAWTQLGGTVTAATTTSIFSSTSPLDIGAVDGGLQQTFGGDISHVTVRDGIGASGVVGGTTRFNFAGAVDLAGITPTATSFTATSGQTVTVNRSGTNKTAIASLGTGDIKTAAGAGDRAAVAYFPTDRNSVTVDTSVISGTGNVRVRWLDPTSG
ncbi:MAG TPA: DUF4038 domain-containing protein, partial [Nitrospiraceae bacterium]|nr:DUF4038 domain-containing protein [Nitrospiraceae bacterium]